MNYRSSAILARRNCW